jgi:hypothetical protein
MEPNRLRDAPHLNTLDEDEARVADAARESPRARRSVGERVVATLCSVALLGIALVVLRELWQRNVLIPAVIGVGLTLLFAVIYATSTSYPPGSRAQRLLESVSVVVLGILVVLFAAYVWVNVP